MRIKPLIAVAAMMLYLVTAVAAHAADAETIRAPAGYFALQPGDPAVLQPGSKRLVSDAQLALPQVAGLTIRARWAWLHPSAGKFDLSFLETQTARCERLG